jgi:hypothetical protein
MVTWIFRLLAVGGLALLAACGSLERPQGPLRIAPDQILRVQDPRIASNDSEALQVLSDDFSRRVASERPPQLLALSGGGANGAYGAGVIVGWTQRGDRPQFDVVTGISTGALAAPFAFLGPDWDDELEAAFTDGQASTLLGRDSLAIFVGPSLFSSSALRNLIDSHVTTELLAAIAAEHARGRTLLVVTTNLDTQETIIWNMGVLASQGDVALPLFRDVLLASASIPGVFPPVLIPGLTDGGEVVLEMHVDGGVNVPFLAVPEQLLLWTAPPSRRGRGGQIFVILNGQAGVNMGVTPGHLPDILARAYDSMSRASARQTLAVTGAFAARNGLRLSATAIPDNANVSSLRFDQATMTALFTLGRDRAISGQAWMPVVVSDHFDPLAPNLVPESEIPEDLRLPAASATPGTGDAG